MAARTRDGRAFRILTILDEYTRECLRITVARRIAAQDVIYWLGELSLERGIPEHIRSDNGPKFRARAIRQWLRELRVKSLYIELGSP
jgi:putative transposase